MTAIAATILTGFLGSGKTTLLKRILSEAHGQKIAVIENEFGEENIDNDILVSDGQEQIIQMSNGCICCSIREDLRATLTMLAEKKAAGALDFDRVIIETTGLADPGPVAQTFFMDDVVAENYILDAIITLVDAKHASQQLDTRLEAQRQVGFADQIFISKADLVDAQHLHHLQHRLHAMNPRAAQAVVHFGNVELAKVLDVRGFNLNARLDLEPDFLHPAPHHHKERCGCGGHDDGHGCHDHDAHGCCHGDNHHHDKDGCCGGHDDGHCCHDHDAHGCCHGDNHHHGEHSCCHGAHHHHHHDDVQSFVFRTQRPFDPAKLEDFLGAIVQIYGPQMYRYKGVLDMQGTPRKVIFQGVHQLMGSDLGARWAEGEVRESKMVFIGVKLPRDILTQGLEQCLV